MRRTISTAKRMRLPASPPQASLRLLVRGAVNWLMQVAFRAHHLDAVVAGLRGRARAVRTKARIWRSTPRGRQRTRRERIDRRLQPARRHLQRAVAVAAGMQDLQADAAAVVVHRPVTWRWRRTSQGQRSVPPKGLSQPARFGEKPPVTIRPTPPAARSREVGRQLREVGDLVLQAGVHRAHQHAVAAGCRSPGRAARTVAGSSGCGAGDCGVAGFAKLRGLAAVMGEYAGVRKGARCRERRPAQAPCGKAPLR